MKEEITITQKVSYQRISDLLCNAFEGGSNYWYDIVGYVRPKDEDLWHPDKNDPIIHRHLQYPLSKGGVIRISSIDKFGYDELTLEKIHLGMKIMARRYPQHFANVINENDDAETGDVFLQCCLFGEVIYG